MIIKASNKLKILAVIVIGTIFGGAVFLYQKLFGGEIVTLPDRAQVADRGQVKDNKNVMKEKKIVSVVRAENPAEGVRKVVEETGGMDFIKPGQKILIKANVNSDDPAPGTTHPEALAEVVRLVKEKGGYAIVGDLSNPNYDTITAMKKTGMYEAVQKAGADEIVKLGEDWVRVKPEGADSWPKGFRIPKLVTQVDHIISVPVLHTHSITSHSLALKNLVGVLHIADRMLFHASSKRDEMITEISLAVKPTLTVIDGTKSFIDGGPSSGTVAESKVYLASSDIVTADVVGVELLKQEGAKLFWDSPWDSRQIVRAIELNLSPLGRDGIEKEASQVL